MLTNTIIKSARALLSSCKAHGLRVATAESCTGGLLGAALTEIPGSSDVFDRGFVTYSNVSKHQLLGVSKKILARHGAVSRETAEAMTSGALARAPVHLVVAITGVAGPGSSSKDKPAGLVHFAAAARGGKIVHHVSRYGDIGRAKVRQKSVLQALSMLKSLAAKSKPNTKRK